MNSEEARAMDMAVIEQLSSETISEIEAEVQRYRRFLLSAALKRHIKENQN